jgi:hypothetical protein
MLFLSTAGINGTDNFSKTDSNPSFARKMSIFRNWFDIST